MGEKHHVVYDQYGGSGRCSKCDAEEYYGMSWDNTCPGDPAIAAAHRAGAREAYRVIVEELTEAGSNYESASRWLLGVDRHKAQISHSVVSEMLFRIEPIAARYAEPEEEKKG